VCLSNTGNPLTTASRAAKRSGIDDVFFLFANPGSADGCLLVADFLLASLDEEELEEEPEPEQEEEAPAKGEGEDDLAFLDETAKRDFWPEEEEDDEDEDEEEDKDVGITETQTTRE